VQLAPNAQFALKVQGSFSWGLIQTHERALFDLIDLKQIDLEIRKGEFVCVIGSVAQGKTSLAQAIAGNLIHVPSDCCDDFFAEQTPAQLTDLAHAVAQFQYSAAPILHSGSLGFADINFWTYQKSIRDTVLFGSLFEEPKYELIMKACLLGDLLADGQDVADFDCLSERTKALVSLARTLY
jgi:energy-coupling factor transporter ATP-binding protein EcfA2